MLYFLKTILVDLFRTINNYGVSIRATDLNIIKLKFLNFIHQILRIFNSKKSSYPLETIECNNENNCSIDNNKIREIKTNNITLNKIIGSLENINTLDESPNSINIETNKEINDQERIEENIMFKDINSTDKLNLSNVQKSLTLINENSINNEDGPVKIIPNESSDIIEKRIGYKIETIHDQATNYDNEKDDTATNNTSTNIEKLANDVIHKNYEDNEKLDTNNSTKFKYENKVKETIEIFEDINKCEYIIGQEVNKINNTDDKIDDVHNLNKVADNGSMNYVKEQYQNMESIKDEINDILFDDIYQHSDDLKETIIDTTYSDRNLLKVGDCMNWIPREMDNSLNTNNSRRLSLNKIVHSNIVKDSGSENKIKSSKSNKKIKITNSKIKITNSKIKITNKKIKKSLKKSKTNKQKNNKIAKK